MVERILVVSTEMEDVCLKEDEMVAQLMSMGFEHHLALEAIRNPKLHSIGDVVDYLLAGDSSCGVEGPLKEHKSDLQESNCKSRVNPDDDACNMWNFKEKVKTTCSDDACVKVETGSMKASIEAPSEVAEQSREKEGVNKQGFWVQEAGAWGGFDDEVFDDEEHLQETDTAEENIVTRVFVPFVPKKKLVIGLQSESGRNHIPPSRNEAGVSGKDNHLDGVDMPRDERLIGQGNTSANAGKLTYGTGKLTDRLTGSTSGAAQASARNGHLLASLQEFPSSSNSCQEFRVVQRGPMKPIITDGNSPPCGSKRYLVSGSPTSISSESARKRCAVDRPAAPEVLIPDDFSTGGRDSSNIFSVKPGPIQIVSLESEKSNKAPSNSAHRFFPRYLRIGGLCQFLNQL